MWEYVISHNAQYGTRYKGFEKCPRRLMKRRAEYAVKTAQQQA